MTASEELFVNAPLCTVHLYAHVHTYMYLHSTQMLIHTHAQNYRYDSYPMSPIKASFSISCHQYVRMFTQYSTDIAMHIHSCTIVQWECSIGAGVARSQMPTVLWCSLILSAKVLLVFLGRHVFRNRFLYGFMFVYICVCIYVYLSRWRRRGVR